MMRLKKLSLENWGVHPFLEADLSQGLEISGRNGTGKSSILEAINFIFSKTGYGFNRFVRNGEREASVELEFEFNTHNYRVRKLLHVEKPSRAEMVRDGVQIADNVSSIHEQLKNILSEDILEKLLYVRQSGLTSVLDNLSEKKGKSELDRLFGLDRLETVWQRAGEEEKRLEGEVSGLRDSLKRHGDQAGDYDRRMNDERLKLGKLEEEIAGKAVEFEKVKGRLESDKKELEKLREMQEEKTGLEKRISELKLEKARKKSGLDSIGEKVRELDEKKEKITGLEKSVSGLKNLQDIVEKSRKYAGLGERLSDFEKIGEKENELRELRDALQRFSGLEEKAKATRESLDRSSKEKTKLETLISKIRESRESMKGLKQEGKCPRCGQNVSEMHVARELSSMREEESRLAENLGKASQAVSSLEQKMEGFSRGLEQAASKKSLAQKISETISEQKNQGEEVVKKREALAGEIRRAGFNPSDPDKISGEAERLQKVAGELGALKKEVAVLDEKRRKLGELKVSVEEISGKISAVAEKIGLIKHDPERMRELRGLVDDLTSRKFKLESALETSRIEVKTIKEKIGGIEEKKKDYLDLKKRIGEREEEYKLTRRARRAFHRDQPLVRYLREKFLRKLGKHLTSYFKAFNQNPKYLDVKFSQDYSILVKTTRGVLGLAQLSGGERVQIALAFRLALIDLMSPVRLLILDEPFGSLDEEHRELLGESLNKVASAGQLILVTHVPVDSLHLPARLELEGY